MRPPLWSADNVQVLLAGAAAGLLLLWVSIISEGSWLARAALVVLGLTFLGYPWLVIQAQLISVRDEVMAVHFAPWRRTSMAVGDGRTMVLRPRRRLSLSRTAYITGTDGTPLLDLGRTAFTDQQLAAVAHQCGFSLVD